MSDFVVTAGADFSEVLKGFRSLPGEAQRAGEAIGKGLGAGITDAEKNIGDLASQIRALKAVQAKLPVDSSEYKKAQRDIEDLGRQIGELKRQKVALQADPSSIVALNARLGDLRGELERVAIGSQRFRELQAAVRDTERELQKAGESADQFRLLDGVIQGIAFSLTNSVMGALGAAFAKLQQFVGGYAALDTEIRKAAAAGGESGGYDKLAQAIDRVGIEAAGTQQEVAQLTTELVRGGMTVTQATQALAAIVRGAEATGTAYSRMAEVTAASIKIFGLQAGDATRVVDALVQGANASATSASEMGMAFKYAGPVAKILGVSIEELGVAVGLLANAGIPAAEAGVTLRNGLSKLASAAPQAGKGMGDLTGQAAAAARTMKALNLDIYNVDGTLKPMQETLLKLKAAFGQLDPATKIRMAANLFGGEDDGAKWLSLLGLTVEEIKTLSATMANTKGATDTARDAMQGFEMVTKQLGGTLDSLGNSVGKVGATALLPLLNLANAAVGAVAGLPDPIKYTAISLGLFTTATVAATAAYAIFKRALTYDMIQAAGREILEMSRIFTGVFAKAIVAAKIEWIIFSKAVQTEGMLSAIGGYAVGFGKLAASMAVVALRFAVIAGAIAGIQYLLSGAGDATNDFAASQKALDEIVGQVEKSTKKAAAAISDQGKAARDAGPLVLTWIRNSREELTMLRTSQEFEKMQGGFTKVQQSALAFYSSLRGSRFITDQQKTQAKEYIDQLQKIADIAKAQASTLRGRAVEADRSGDDRLATQLKILAKAAEDEERGSRKAAAALKALTAETRAATAAAVDRLGPIRQTIQAEELLSSRLQNRIAIGQSLAGLAKGLGDVEQSRYGVVRARLQFELSKLQEIGAGEDILKAKRDEADRLDRAALSARYQNLLLQQSLEQRILEINQAKARLEGQKAVNTAQLDLLKAEAELAKETDQAKRASLQEVVDKQAQALTIAREQAALTASTQPIEAAISQLTAETARNNLQAEAAAKGFKIAANGTLEAISGMASGLSGVATYAKLTADEQDRYRRIAADAGLAIGQNSQGTLAVGRSQAEVNTAVAEMNALLDQSKVGFDDTARKASDAASPAAALAQAFTQTGDKAPALLQGAQGFAEYLAQAGGYANDIKGINLEGKFQSVSGSMSSAASSARDFYSYLQQAANLPGSRWTGGPVEAGETYRVNELGQEMLLAAGRLMPIDAPANSLWRAPSSGTVIPAGISARIQATGATIAAGAAAPAGVAELALEVGKLRQEVGALARRDWSIHVQQRTGPTASQVMQQIQRLR